MFETHPKYLAISSQELVAALRRAFMQRSKVCKAPMLQHNVGELPPFALCRQQISRGTVSFCTLLQMTRSLMLLNPQTSNIVCYLSLAVKEHQR
jgi:hypothetical protein